MRFPKFLNRYPRGYELRLALWIWILLAAIVGAVAEAVIKAPVMK